jgi:hypothetical protein
MDTKRQWQDIPKLSAHLKQSRYPAGAVAIQNYCFGKKMLLANAPNVDANMRTPNT